MTRTVVSRDGYAWTSTPAPLGGSYGLQISPDGSRANATGAFLKAPSGDPVVTIASAEWGSADPFDPVGLSALVQGF